LKTKEKKNMGSEKKQLLEAEGYEFDSFLSCYVNRESGKIFSDDWIDANNLNTIQISLLLPHDTTSWKLFLNPDQPHEEMRTALFQKYGNTP
jgi:hypothetical protein